MITLLLFVPLCFGVNSYELKQVVMFGRHNIRSPLVSAVTEYSPKHFPEWNVTAGFSTVKGLKLERFMGKYIADWLIKESVLSDNCPSEDEVFVYANTRERTKETAKAFAEGAFGDCVKAFYKNITGRDPVFDIVVRNGTKIFKDLVIANIQERLAKTDLKEEYAALERVLDFKNSSYCKPLDVCALDIAKHEIIIELNKDPDLIGPMKMSTHVIDSFLMAFYNGMEEDKVAWGEIKTTEQWMKLFNIIKTYHDFRFTTPLLDKDVAKSLIIYLSDVFLNGKKKFYSLVGHDANIIPLMSSLKFAEYNLPNQIENTPIGGKVVFQKWYDQVNDQYLLRVDYVYQSFQQIRDGAVASVENPPQWALLRMKNCPIDKNGFCPWSEFLNILNNVFSG